MPMEEAMNEVGMHVLFTVSQGSYGIGNNVRPIKTQKILKFETARFFFLAA